MDETSCTPKNKKNNISINRKIIVNDGLNVYIFLKNKNAMVKSTRNQKCEKVKSKKKNEDENRKGRNINKYRMKRILFLFVKVKIKINEKYGYSKMFFSAILKREKRKETKKHFEFSNHIVIEWTFISDFHFL